jgi:hypothetical protein
LFKKPKPDEKPAAHDDVTNAILEVAMLAIQDLQARVTELEKLREATKESQRRILTTGEVFPAEKANQLVEDAWK